MVRRWEIRTRCPAKIHSDSLSTASLLRSTLSSIRVIATSSSDILARVKPPAMQVASKQGDTSEEGGLAHLPTKFVFARRHGRDLGMYTDDAFQRPLWRRFCHFGVDVCQYAKRGRYERPCGIGMDQIKKNYMAVASRRTGFCPANIPPNRARCQIRWKGDAYPRDRGHRRAGSA